MTPRPPQRPKTITQHGEVRTDPYAWMRDRNDPAVMEHLEAENRHTEEIMAHTKDLQAALYKEVLGRIKETDMGVPYRMGSYLYYTRTEKGKNYPIFCRKFADNPDANEQIILNLNDLAGEQSFFQLGGMAVSSDDKLLAYSTDFRGNEEYTLHVKDLATDKDLSECVEKISGPIAWAENHQTIFYLTLDDTQRPDRVWRHRLGTSPKEDTLVYHEPDRAFHLSFYKSKSKAFIFLSAESKDTSELRVINADDSTHRAQLVMPRKKGIEYYFEHHDNRFVILTNDQAPNFRFMQTPVNAFDREHWTDFLPYEENRRIDDIQVFEKHVAIFERYRGLKNVRVLRFEDMDLHEISFPESAYTVQATGNREYQSPLLRFTYESPVTPESVFDYDMNSRTRTLLKRKEVPGDYSPDRYAVTRTQAQAPDKTSVPITLLHQKDVSRDRSHPLFLTAYGAYEIPYEPDFDVTAFSLVDRGFVVAIAHIRGGGEMGRPWYQGGKLLKKKNTFSDFVACAEHLVEMGFASKGKIAISGGSAGGLLMGAVTNLRPDLWGAVLAMVPFVDTLNTMSDPSLPLTITEYGEWGNPEEKTYFDYIKSYSPYENVVKAAYPPVLATAGLNDPRVSFWEPAKWVARLRDEQTNTSPILLRTDLDTGHGGPSGRYKRIEELAFHYAFVVDQILTDKKSRP